MGYKDNYLNWLNNPVFDEETKNELRKIEADEHEIKERFSKPIAFGTAGMRGIMTAGESRMNKYTVGRAAVGIAKYLKSNFEGPLSVVIAYDGRNNSLFFAKIVAVNLVKNGIRVAMFDSVTPTPVLSFAVRFMNCSGGFMITASHNPKIYNGLKYYNADGEQPVEKDTDYIIKYIDETDYSEVELDIQKYEYMVETVDRIVEQTFVDYVVNGSILKNNTPESKKSLKIVYTPLHGTGEKYVSQALNKAGFTDFNVVPEQSVISGDFPTVVSPNPEEKAALTMGIELADKIGADIVIGSDPDADRMGIAVRHNGKMYLVSGNQVGALLAYYIFGYGLLPENPVMVKTIVTGNLGQKIAESYGVKVYDTLTGFKNIASVIDSLEENHSGDFVFGYEESYGYLIGTHCRDKDSVSASLSICEAAAFWKSRGKSLIDVLNEIYLKYGYHIDSLDSMVFPGLQGTETMKNLMHVLRNNPHEYIEDIDVIKDYLLGIDGIEKADVLKFFFKDGSFLAARMSGTEPKIKFYYSIECADEESGKQKLEKLKNSIKYIVEKNASK